MERMDSGVPWTAPPVVQRCLLTHERIIFSERLDCAQALFERIGRVAESRGTPSAAEIAMRLLKRHLRRSTALGRGVALPHAEVRGLRWPIAVFVRLRHGIDMNAHDGDPVSEVLALLVPRPATAAHAELLAELTGLLVSASFRERLLHCATAKAICSLFAEAGPRGTTQGPILGPLLTPRLRTR